MHKRAFRFLLMPIGVLLWIGWIMFWVGFRRQEQTRQAHLKTNSESDLVTITAIIPEEVEEEEA